MHILPIIPARFESERFRGKLLAKYYDMAVITYPMNACEAAFGHSLILTDSPEISRYCSERNYECLSMQGSYRNGTERIADACNRLNIADDTLIMHVQGDEVELQPEDLVRLAKTARGSCVSTLFYRTEDEKLLKSMDHVKCWKPKADDANIYGWSFTRGYDRDTTDKIHVGVYAYRRDMLRRYMERWPAEDEKRERLEQLRWDVPILAYEVKPCKSINRPEDLE